MPGWVDDLLSVADVKLILGGLIASLVGLVRELWQERRSEDRTKDRERENRQQATAELLQEALINLRHRF